MLLLLLLLLTTGIKGVRSSRSLLSQIPALARGRAEMSVPWHPQGFFSRWNQQEVPCLASHALTRQRQAHVEKARHLFTSFLQTDSKTLVVPFTCTGKER